MILYNDILALTIDVLDNIRKIFVMFFEELDK